TIVSEGQNAERFRIRLNKLSNGLANVTTNGISLWVANDALNINGENLKDVTIYNALGQVVYNKNLKGNSFKTLLDLPAGAYTAKASSKTSVENLKFVITK
ncbi:MAG: T9SS type A sorting domain-containing protein, partial [Bacteroidales bacterium]|nr:T9SS type A sorting domain-containing protein [Bacteroidales bacterium]